MKIIPEEASNEFYEEGSNNYDDISSDLSSLDGFEGETTEVSESCDPHSCSLENLMKKYEDVMKNDPELISRAISMIQNKGDNNLSEMIKSATESQAFKDLMGGSTTDELLKKLADIGTTDFGKQCTGRVDELFLDACESGDLETVKSLLYAVRADKVFQGIKLAINTRRLFTLDYLLANQIDDRDFMGNIWYKVCANLSPENPVVDVLLKHDTNFQGLIPLCEAGNVALVEYFLEKDKGKETISLQRGLNHSVRGNCLELVKKFVELGTDKDGKVTLDIDAAARWLKATKSNGNEEAKIADFLDRLSPGCTLRGACDVMSIIFGNSQMPSSDESFKKITEKISMVGREYPEPEQKDERLLAASEVMDEITESTGLPKELIENLKTQMREIANLPDEEKKQEAIQEMFNGIFGLSSADLHHYDPDFHPNL